MTVGVSVDESAHAPFARGLSQLFDAAFQFAGLVRPESLEAWLAVAVPHGPTPRKGPLANDVVVGRGRVGFNVFQYGSRPSVELALDWTEAQVGVPARRALETLLDGLPRTVEVQPGAFWSQAGPRLKLYLGLGAPGALAVPCTRLGLGAVPDAVALAVDATSEGLVNARSYRMGALAAAETATLGVTAQAWLTKVEKRDGLAHPLLTCRGTWPHPQSKRSLVRTFTPYAALDQLWALDRELAALGCAALDAALVEWLCSEDARLRELGLQLRPVAHETDLYPDGRAEAEAFVTLALAD